MNFPAPPHHLSKASKDVWRTIVTDYAPGLPAALAILASALEVIDRAKDAAATLRKEGMVVEGQRGIPKAHPLVAVESACREQAANLWKKLGR